jgi:uncharacterized membrane protein YfcA
VTGPELLPWLFPAGVILLAYTVRGIAGFGSALVAVPLLVLILPLPLVVPVIALLDYLGSATHGLRHREAIQWRSLLPLLPFTLIGVLLALYLFKTFDASLLTRALGGFVLVYALYSLFSPVPQRRGSLAWALPGGFLGGLIGTLFGTGGPFYVIYLQMQKLDKTAFRASIAAILLLDGGLRLAGYALGGFYDGHSLGLALAALPLMMLGMYLGGHIHLRLSPRRFRQAIALLLLVSGSVLLLK